MNTIVLAATTSKLQAVLASAPTTECSYTTHYGISTPTTFVEGETDGATNGSTAVDIVAAPAAGERRIIREVTVYNPNSGDVTLTIQYNNNGTARIIWKGIVSSGTTWTLSSNLLTSTIGPADGWYAAAEAWSYTSPGVISMTGDKTGLYSIGDKVRFKQGAGYLYFYITEVSTNGSTTYLAILGNTLANAAITDNYYSKVSSPNGFPHWFAYTPTFGGFSGTPTESARFCIVGRKVTVFIYMITGTSNATNFTISAPITSANNGVTQFVSALGVNNGSQVATPVVATLTPASSTINVYKDWTGAAWTNTGTKMAHFTLDYEM